MDNSNNAAISISGALAALKSKRISAVELLGETFKRIKTARLNAYICLNEEQAYKIALNYDNGKLQGRLAGIPIAIKDNINVKGLPTTCASRALENSLPKTKNADAVQMLINEGAIVVGKTNMDEFAMGSSNLTSVFGRVLNPIDNERVCGGSSGGSACAAAAGLCLAAIGSDTGGSIRQPSSYCGVVGLKPSPNKISKNGLYPLAPEFDQIGPIARTVADCELLFDIMSGAKTKAGFRRMPVVGVLADLPIKWAEASNAMQAALAHYKQLGCKIVEVSVPLFAAAHEVYDVDAYAQMYKSLSALKLDESLLGCEVKKRLKAGLGYLMNPQTIAAAKKIKEQMSAQFDFAFSSCDVVITPSAPTAAFHFNEDFSSDAVRYSDFFTQPPSVCNLSALSVPFYKQEQNLPLGVQVVGKAEEEVFAAAKLLTNEF